MSTTRIAFDTSVAIRFLTAEPFSQFTIATAYFNELLKNGETAHVSDLVLSEAYFALQRFYGMSKATSLAALADFASIPGITLSPHALAVLTLPGLATAKPGFVDRLVHGASQSAGHTLITFEKAAKKLPGTVVLYSE